MPRKKDIPATRLLRYDQVVARLHGIGLDDMDEKSIRNMADRGHLPFVKVGKYRRFREDVLEDVIRDWMDTAA